MATSYTSLRRNEESPDGTAWYCVRSKNRCEHIAAAHLRQIEAVEAFCPRVEYQRTTRRGKVRFQQAMFPGYLFARFSYESQKRMVVYSHGVTGLVHFGDYVPPIQTGWIEFLRKEVGEKEIKVLKPQLNPGDEVEIAEGPLKGLRAVVEYYMPAKDRVRVLLELLGSEKLTEIPCSDLVALKYE